MKETPTNPDQGYRTHPNMPIEEQLHYLLLEFEGRHGLNPIDMIEMLLSQATHRAKSAVHQVKGWENLYMSRPQHFDKKETDGTVNSESVPDA